MYFDYRYHGTSFEQTYRCYPASFIDKPQIENGDKIIMPPSALDRLASLHIDYPMLFELRNTATERVSHCGVLEFIAEEGLIYMPYWMMENLLLKEGDIVRIKNVTLPKGTYVKLQPHTSDFLSISNPKAILETTLRNFSCLTTGDSIMVAYNNKKYYIDIIESKPSSAITIIETDCEVDFAAPLDYKEPERPVSSIPSSKASAEGGQAGLTELPEKYKLLSDLFFAMTSSVRLLNLNKKQFPVFHYISRQVERITGSKFSYRNLAQMKFIFPEAIQTDKILLRNNKTFLMEPHLKVSFLFDVVEGHTEPSDFLALYHAFSSRLLTFVRLHSEDFDVPEAELPEPFNHREIPELYKRREIVAANIFPLKRLPPNDDASGLINSHVPPFKRSRFARMVGREELLIKLSEIKD